MLDVRSKRVYGSRLMGSCLGGGFFCVGQYFSRVCVIYCYDSLRTAYTGQRVDSVAALRQGDAYGDGEHALRGGLSRREPREDGYGAPAGTSDVRRHEALSRLRRRGADDGWRVERVH